MKIAVIGANGQLGSDICQYFNNEGYDVIGLVHEDIEIGAIDSVAATLKHCDAPVVINTAAMHHVEKCEQAPIDAFKSNALGCKNLALVCNNLKTKLIHISTDYVFSGSKREPYVESDLPGPLNVYANTKLSGEYFISAIAESYQIVRVGGLYGKHPCRAKGLNFVYLMKKLASEREEVRVVDDEEITPTPTAAVARQLLKLVQADSPNGIYHCTAEGSCTWYGFARQIFLLLQIDTPLVAAAPEEFPMKVMRPKYSVLENYKLKSNELNVMRNWEDELAGFLKVAPE